MEITGEVERHEQIIFELKEKISKKGGETAIIEKL